MSATAEYRTAGDHVPREHDGRRSCPTCDHAACRCPHRHGASSTCQHAA